MSVTAELERRSRRRYRKPCPLGDLLATVKGKERADIEAALAKPNDRIRASVILDWLGEEGYKLETNPEAVDKHRRQICRCYES